MREISIWFAVAAGGSIGAVLRYAVSNMVSRWASSSFPWGTLVVNVLGSFALGLLLATLLARVPPDGIVRSFLAMGVLGAFTTFSTFSMDIVMLIERKAFAIAGGYLLASVVISIMALLAGLTLGRLIS